MTKFSAAILLASAATASASLMHPREKYEADFVNHIAKYNLKIADGNAFSQRLSAFAANSDLIEAHSLGNSTFTIGHNEFSHLTFEEFREQYLMTPAPRIEETRMVNAFENVKAPASVDWEGTGFVTAVKDQGQCGSCWAFSTTGGLEGAWYLKNKVTLSFSEQQLVACDSGLLKNHGCNGGLMDNAFKYVKTDGICTESDYPYTSGAGDAGKCDSSCTKVSGTKSMTYTDVANSEAALMAAVAQQPVSVAVDADSNWQLYTGGILTTVSGTALDHGVLAVGYSSDYWKIKNSWSASWGENGYIRIARSSQTNGPCGITSSASYPTFV